MNHDAIVELDRDRTGTEAKDRILQVAERSAGSLAAQLKYILTLDAAPPVYP